MLTQLNIIHDKRGYTVTVSTTHRTHPGALAHFTELLAQFTHDHQQAAARGAALAAAAAGDAGLIGAPDLSHRWDGPEHDGWPVPELATAPCLVATTAEDDERAALAPAPLFRFGVPVSRRLGGEEPPF